MPYRENSFNNLWIEQGIKEDTVEWAKDFGEFLQEASPRERGRPIQPITTSQIRKFFGEAKRIQMNFKDNHQDIPLLKVKLAYAVGRDKENGRSKSKLDSFYSEVSNMLSVSGSQDQTKYNRFVKIIESIIAFHKYFGGK